MSGHRSPVTFVTVVSYSLAVVLSLSLLISSDIFYRHHILYILCSTGIINWGIFKASKVSCSSYFPEVLQSWFELFLNYRLCVERVLMKTFWSKGDENHQVLHQKLMYDEFLNCYHGICTRSHQDALRRLVCLRSLPPVIVRRDRYYAMVGVLTCTNQPLFVASHTITEMDAKKAIKLTHDQTCQDMEFRRKKTKKKTTCLRHR